MIKNYHRRKLNRPGSARRLLLSNLAEQLFLHEKIITTYARAKEAASFAEKIITQAKNPGLSSRRQVYRRIKDEVVRRKIYDVLVPRYQNRSGGYSRVFRLARRTGDGARMALLTLIS